MSGINLTDRQRVYIQPFLPPPARTGRPRADDRRTIEGILYVLFTGCRWQDLPREYLAPTRVWRRLRRWGEEGVWECIWRAALAALDQHGKLDWSMAFLDGSFVPAKKGGEKAGLTTGSFESRCGQRLSDAQAGSGDRQPCLPCPSLLGP